jgi:hypothetical protein
MIRYVLDPTNATLTSSSTTIESPMRPCFQKWTSELDTPSVGTLLKVVQTCLPADTSCAHMHEYLAGSGLRLGFLDEVDLVRRVIKRGDVHVKTRYFALLQDPELGRVEHFAGVVDGRVRLGDLGSHGHRKIGEGVEIACQSGTFLYTASGEV